MTVSVGKDDVIWWIRDFSVVSLEQEVDQVITALGESTWIVTTLPRGFLFSRPGTLTPRRIEARAHNAADRNTHDRDQRDHHEPDPATLVGARAAMPERTEAHRRTLRPVTKIPIADLCWQNDCGCNGYAHP